MSDVMGVLPNKALQWMIALPRCARAALTAEHQYRWTDRRRVVCNDRPLLPSVRRSLLQASGWTRGSGTGSRLAPRRRSVCRESRISRSTFTDRLATTARSPCAAKYG